MFASRLGSLNAVEQSRGSVGWKRLLGRSRFPSADTMGRVASTLDHDEIRDLIRSAYSRLKRRKALPASSHGLGILVVDGHETTASYRRSCTKCLKREVTTAAGVQTQYFHRIVAASLVGKGFHLFLDVEPIEAGETELAAAIRVIRRIHSALPRSFDVVVADAFYAQALFFKAVLEMGKHVVTVLKQEARELMRDARSIFETLESQGISLGRTRASVHDSDDFESWWTLGRRVRVVRSVERRGIRRQIDGRWDEIESEWWWVTTLDSAVASTRTIIEIGHARWKIENEGFNEAANHFFLDHVYRHDPRAMIALYLVGFLVYNVVHAFYRRNLKPERRETTSLRMITEYLKAELIRRPVALAHAPP
jgi:hypothetical protein